MRKKLAGFAMVDSSPERLGPWLHLHEIASVEVTSEDPNFPIEFALIPCEGPGWRAAEKGAQIIRILFDRPIMLHRILLDFAEPEIERTQEFTLRWSEGIGTALKEIVRQQWNFSPYGSTREIEVYQVSLENVSVLELMIQPGGNDSFATLSACRLA
jgi:hypothetical protein